MAVEGEMVFRASAPTRKDAVRAVREKAGEAGYLVAVVTTVWSFPDQGYVARGWGRPA